LVFVNVEGGGFERMDLAYRSGSLVVIREADWGLDGNVTTRVTTTTEQTTDWDRLFREEIRARGAGEEMLRTAIKSARAQVPAIVGEVTDRLRAPVSLVAPSEREFGRFQSRISDGSTLAVLQPSEMELLIDVSSTGQQAPCGTRGVHLIFNGREPAPSSVQIGWDGHHWTSKSLAPPAPPVRLSGSEIRLSARIAIEDIAWLHGRRGGRDAPMNEKETPATDNHLEWSATFEVDCGEPPSKNPLGVLVKLPGSARYPGISAVRKDVSVKEVPTLDGRQ
jgi:hypothetical protein